MSLKPAGKTVMNIQSVPFPYQGREKGQPCQIIKSKCSLLAEWKALGVLLTGRLQTLPGIWPSKPVFVLST